MSERTPLDLAALLRKAVKDLPHVPVFQDELLWLLDAAEMGASVPHDEGGLPVHFPMGVDAEGHGPTEPDEPHHRTCWCGTDCPWTRALAAERAAQPNDVG